MGKYKIVGHEYLFDFGENAKHLSLKVKLSLKLKL
jgi:hypothetical protein